MRRASLRSKYSLSVYPWTTAPMGDGSESSA